MPVPSYDPWFVLRLRSNFEKISSDCLKSKGYVTFLPVYRTRRRWSDRVKEIEAPLFPGYTFCAFNALERLPILTTPGVISIIESSSGPIPVPESDILAVQAMVQSGLPIGPWPFLRQGQRVLVERGPLQGTEGIIVKLKDNYRLVASISLLQRSVAVEIDRDWVRPLAMPPAREFSAPIALRA